MRKILPPTRLSQGNSQSPASTQQNKKYAECFSLQLLLILFPFFSQKPFHMPKSRLLFFRIEIIV